MTTRHLHRLHIICPLARVAAVNSWLKANLDPEGEDWLTPNLSATGDPPYTHAECSAALTNAEIKLLLGEIARIASRSLPADWDTRTRAQKKAWLATARDTLNTGSGIYLNLSDNDGAWDDAAVARATKGVQPARVPPGQ